MGSSVNGSLESLLIAELMASPKTRLDLAPFVEVKELSDLGQIIYSLVMSSDEEVSSEYLKVKIDRQYQDKVKKALLEYVDFLPGQSGKDIVNEFLLWRRNNIGDALASALLARREGNIETLIEEWQTYNRAASLNDLKQGEQQLGIAELLDATLNPDFKISLKGLKRIVPGFFRGQHVGIFARPNIGKTGFLVDFMVRMVKSGYRVLYAGNEDPLKLTQLRVISRMTGFNSDVLKETDQEKINTILDSSGYDRLVLKSLEFNTIAEIRRLVREYEPDILMVDQVRNLDLGYDGLTTTLEQAGIQMRRIIKQFNILGITVTQAGETASNKRILTLSDIDSSKTGLPAQYDVMIGIGADSAQLSYNQRTLSVCKNKVNGNHTSCVVKLDPTISKFSSL